MAQIDAKDKKYMITFKRKDLRPNKRDDKFELFRHAVGLEDVRDILDLSRYKDNHMTDEISKTVSTVTDINSYDCPFVFARLTEYQVGRLRRDPNVLIVEEDGLWHIAEEVQGWQVPILRAPNAWASPLSCRGQGVNVAIIDTGCNPHLDLGGNLKVNQNFTTRPGTAAEDPNHHGTHVCGIAGALEGNNEGIQGIAPACNIWNLRAGDNTGAFPQTDSIEGIQYATQNGAHVINMSFGGTGSGNTAGEQAVTAAWNADIILFGAAGNTGIQEAAFYPAAFPNVLGISNIASTGALHVTSSWGTYVDFTGPGGDIVSLAENNLYRTLTGTSMACPAISGVAALCVQAFGSGGGSCPPADPSSRRNQAIQQALTQTAIKSGLSSPGPVGTRDIRYGYGLPQAGTAVSSLKGVLPTALAR
jgi:subtilisin